MIIKRSPQEIADFTGCYVAEAKGRTELLFLYEKRPPLTGNWSRLYEPYSAVSPIPDNKKASYSKESAIPDNKPDHSSEVFIHKEYVVAEGNRTQDLSKKVNILLNHGWKLQGGVAVEYLPESDGYKEGSETFYQAMVRGI